jgi:hypothetical protein
MRVWAVRHRIRVFVHRIRFPGQPLFTDAAISDLLGKTVMVGITTVDRGDIVLRRDDFRGRIIRANVKEAL